jgi:hypothetical protein
VGDLVLIAVLKTAPTRQQQQQKKRWRGAGGGGRESRRSMFLKFVQFFIGP